MVISLIELFALVCFNFLRSKDGKVLFAGLFPAKFSISKHVLNEVVDTLRAIVILDFVVHELCETNIDCFLLFDVFFFGFGRCCANTFLQNSTDLVDKVEPCFEGFIGGLLVIKSKKTGKNLENDSLRNQVHLVKLTNEVDVTEKLLFVFKLFLLVCHLTNLFSHFKNLDERITAESKQVTPEATVLYVCSLWLISFHFELEADDV